MKSRPKRGQAEEDALLFPKGKPAVFSKHRLPQKYFRNQFMHINFKTLSRWTFFSHFAPAQQCNQLIWISARFLLIAFTALSFLPLSLPLQSVDGCTDRWTRDIRGLELGEKGRDIAHAARRVGVMARYREYLCQRLKGCGLILGNWGMGQRLTPA